MNFDNEDKEKMKWEVEGGGRQIIAKNHSELGRRRRRWRRKKSEGDV